jgi:hypothetical protein
MNRRSSVLEKKQKLTLGRRDPRSGLVVEAERESRY